MHALSLLQQSGQYSALSIRAVDTAAAQRIWFGSGGSAAAPIHWTELWHRANTTVDTNGFVKEASPIVRLFDDHIEEPAEPVGAAFGKTGLGHYTLDGVPGLACAGWQIELPRDDTGTPLVLIATDHDEDAARLTLRCHRPVWDGGWTQGAPCNIPSDRWIDLRLAAG